MDAPLNQRQLTFVVEYLRLGGNGKQAAIAAGYSEKTAESQASRLLSHAKVAAELARRQQKQLAKVELSADVVLREFLRIATADIAQAFDEHGALKRFADMPEDIRRAIAGFEVEQLSTEGAAIGTVTKVKFWDKNTALTNLAKNLKLLTDRVEIAADSSFADALKAARERADADPEG